MPRGDQKGVAVEIGGTSVSAIPAPGEIIQLMRTVEIGSISLSPRGLCHQSQSELSISRASAISDIEVMNSDKVTSNTFTPFGVLICMPVRCILLMHMYITLSSNLFG